jgi:hypothetical protein
MNFAVISKINRKTYVLNDHDEEGQLNTEGLVGVSGACDVVSGDICAHDLEDT